MEVRHNEARIEWRERPIVRVDATVMSRGELGCFTPYLGCGNSRVAIFESVTKTEYLLYGYKLHDKKVTLNCLIPQKMPFTKGCPIFHHWVIGGQSMGLSFNGTADARSFDRGIRVVLENLEKAASSNRSGSTTSDEPNSASPTSTQSFILPEDSSSMENQTNVAPSPSARRPPVLPRQNASNTLPHTFRPQAMSASSRRHPTQPSCMQRRHSSSIPGRPPLGTLAPQQSTSPVGMVCLPGLPVSTTLTCGASSTTGTHSEKRNDEEKVQDEVPAPAAAPELSHRPTSISSRRNRPRHQTEPHHRSRRTKTPNLDNLERQRDLQPTKPNSYVQIASSGNPAVLPRTAPCVSFTRSGYRRGDDLHLNCPTRFPPQRTGIRSSYDYRYHGVKSSDDSHTDFYGKTLFHQTSSFSSFSDANTMLKQPSLHKGKDFGKYKEDLSERSRCRYCQVMFNHDRNRPGSCPDAPKDACETCIERVTCLCAPRCVSYSCFRDSEGDYDQEPCTCSRSRYTSYSGRRRRWLVLGILSIFLPCLCLYPLLKGCHSCGVACHCCGGRHKAVVPSSESQDQPVNRC